jgi:NADH-quinone oxidoreductase subunit E
VSFFTDANEARAKEIVARYPRAKSAILPLAHLAQDQHGWLTAEAMDEIAELTGVTAADVQGTCSFYTMLKRRPCGRLVVSVCTNVTCLVTGGPEILEHLEDRYADDVDVTVEEVECIAACGGAPAMQVNYEFHERLTADTAQSIVDEYRAGTRTARTVSGSVV